MYDLAAGVVEQLLYDGNELGREAVVLHDPPDDVSVHTVECLLKVDKYRVQWGLPFHRLLDDDLQCGDVVCAGSALAKTCLLLS